MSCVYVDWLLAGSFPILPAASQHKRMAYTNCFKHRAIPPDDEKKACSKQVEVNYWNKLKVNSASCSLLLYGYITMYGQQNITFFYTNPLNITSHDQWMWIQVDSHTTPMQHRTSYISASVTKQLRNPSCSHRTYCNLNSKAAVTQPACCSSRLFTNGRRDNTQNSKFRPTVRWRFYDLIQLNGSIHKFSTLGRRIHGVSQPPVAQVLKHARFFLSITKASVTVLFHIWVIQF